MVVVEAVLLAGFESGPFAEVVTVLTGEPLSSASTVMDTVTWPFCGSSPSWHVTTPLVWLQLPWLGVAEMKAVCGDSVSMTVNPEADSPESKLVTEMEYWIVSPARTGSGVSVKGKRVTVVGRSNIGTWS